MKPLLALSLLFLTACGPVLLVHPKTGERVSCRHSARHPLIDALEASSCARQYESLGFVRAGELTADQRATIQSKPLPQEIHLKNIP